MFFCREFRMDQIRRIMEKQNQLSEKWWFSIILFLYELTLAAAAVLPLMYHAIQTVPFCYEVNDDALVAQFLDGSYTGSPEAHAFYVRYPLSWLIARLYEKNPALPKWLWPAGVPGTSAEALTGKTGAALAASGTNWYVFTIAALSVFAMVCVLFRILHAFRGNRIILCVLFDLAVGLLWLPHFFYMTFTTAATFMGVMGILFFGFMDAKEASRPWNLLILTVLLGSCWCLRQQCFLMVMPFIAVILVLKFRLLFFRSWRPWFTVLVIGAMIFGLMQAEKAAYGSEDWQAYRTYNSERSWMQDYGRIPSYEGNEEFYQGIGMGEEAVTAFKRYTYCLMDDFGPEKVHTIYEYAYAQQPEEKFDLTSPEGIKEAVNKLRPKVEEMIPVAQETFNNPENISEYTGKIINVLWEILIPLLLLSLVTVRDRRWSETFVLLLEIVSLSALVGAEWIYLMMNGRFPQRVEETIWLLTFCIGVLLAGRILTRWNKIRWCRLPGLVQIILLVWFLQYSPYNLLPEAVPALQAKQIGILAEQTAKAEVLSYCGEHPDNRYVLRTTSVSTTNPYDDLHQDNWYMSGSWAAYSPLYYQKLAGDETESLGIDFLKRNNVYIITQGENGKANITKMLGRSKSNPVYAVKEDTITTSDGTEFLIYKVY